MNNKFPDFYITSSESNILKQPRQCFSIKRFPAAGRDDYLLIRINPPIEANSYDIAKGEINKLIIASRHKGESLFSIVKWPVEVYVLRVLVENPEEHDLLKDNELELIGWAEICDSEETIRKNANKLA